jgi:Domain of unknown function (DUF4403)
MYRITFVLASFFLFPFCKTAKVTNAPKPAENYTAVEETPLVSTIAVPVNIAIDDLVRTLNTKLSEKALYEDYSYDDNGGDDLMMNAWKSQDITLYVSGNTIKYRVPVKLWIKKRLIVGEAEATGELALSFKTSFSINPDWSLTTQTEVEYHEWIQSPVLKTGLGSIGIEALSNLVLNRSKRTMAQTLDRVVSQQLSLRPAVQEVWNVLQVPTLLSDDYKMWVKY